MLSQKELDLRRFTIGSSDVPAIIGVSPWKPRWKIVRAKLLGDHGPQGQIYSVLGHKLERPIAETALELGMAPGKVLIPGWTIKKDWRSATPDFYALKDGSMTYLKRRPIKEEEAYGLEIKNVGVGMMRDWKKGKTPEYVQAQVQWQMLVLGYSVIYVVCLLGGSNIRVTPIERNDIWLAKTEKICHEVLQEIEAARTRNPHLYIRFAQAKHRSAWKKAA